MVTFDSATLLLCMQRSNWEHTSRHLFCGMNMKLLHVYAIRTIYINGIRFLWRFYLYFILFFFPRIYYSLTKREIFLQWKITNGRTKSTLKPTRSGNSTNASGKSGSQGSALSQSTYSMPSHRLSSPSALLPPLPCRTFTALSSRIMIIIILFWRTLFFIHTSSLLFRPFLPPTVICSFLPQPFLVFGPLRFVAVSSAAKGERATKNASLLL